jgi:hypothetical protein
VTLKDYESDWKSPFGWIIRTVSGRFGPPSGGTLTFEGNGDGSPDSAVLLNGRPWGERCRYEPEADSVTFDVAGEGLYRAMRDTTSVPAALTGALASPGGSSGGSWTAEEGSAGIRQAGGGLLG